MSLTDFHGTLWTKNREARRKRAENKIKGIKIPRNQKEKEMKSIHRLTIIAALVLPIISSAKVSRLPSSYDLRQTLGLNPVKNQGECGSAWAYAMTASAETAIKMQDGLSVDLSEQFLIDCNSKGWGCDGGDVDDDMLVNTGVVLTKDFPANSTVAACTQAPIFRKMKGWGTVKSDPQTGAPTVDAIKEAIYLYGAVAAYVSADSAFSAYSSGVFDHCSAESQINHIVAIVGWDDAGGYWIVRNSWGSAWGESGYMRIKYGCNSIGNSAFYVY